MKRQILIFLTCFACVACELHKEIDYTSYFDEERIIIHGFVSVANEVELLAKKSLAPNRVDGDDRLSNPRALLFEDGQQVAVLVLADDGYHFTTPAGFQVSEGARYHVIVQADSVPDAVSAQQFLFNPVAIDSLAVTKSSDIYTAVVYWMHHADSGYGYYVEPHPFMNGEDLFIPSKWDKFPMMGHKDFPSGVIASSVSFSERIDSIHINLYSFSPDLYRFLQSEKDYDDSREDPFFEQPYPVFSNIEGGYGVFGAYGVVKVGLYVRQHPELVNLQDYDIDYADAVGLWSVCNDLEHLYTVIDDIVMTSGSEAMHNNTHIYKLHISHEQ